MIDVPEPKAGPGDILVRMSLCGICGTDLMKVYDTDTPKPVQLGHEIVGTVAALGEGVSRFKLGELRRLWRITPDYGSHSRPPWQSDTGPHQAQQRGARRFCRGGPRAGGSGAAHGCSRACAPCRKNAVFMEPLACCLRALDRVMAEGDTVPIAAFAPSVGCSCRCPRPQRANEADRYARTSDAAAAVHVWPVAG